MFTLVRSFVETIYLEPQGSHNQWEIDVELHGTITPEEPRTWNDPAIPAEVDIEGLVVTGARIEGLEIDSETVLHWLDREVNFRYWWQEKCRENCWQVSDEILLPKLHDALDNA